MAAGEVTFRAPRGAQRTVSLRAGDVHSLVLWSKSYAPLLARPAMRRRLAELNPYFHFSITGLGGSSWEPGVPSWKEAVKEIAVLVNAFGGGRVNWRFDPVVYWREGSRIRSNLPLVTQIGERLAALGVCRCTFSFVRWYRKSLRRVAQSELPYLDPPRETRLEAAAELAAAARALGISLSGCCTDDVLGVTGIARGRCVDGELLANLRDDRLAASRARDRSQREHCGCSRSIDIGSYSQRCPDPCIYCYAN